MLSPQEFSHFIIDPSTPPALAQLFRNDPTLTAILRSYLFLTHSMDHLEHALERHRVEQLVLFERLVDSRIFEPRVEPLIRDFRQKTRRYRIRPYNCPSSLIPTLFSLNSSPTSSVIESETVDDPSTVCCPTQSTRKNLEHEGIPFMS